MTVILGDLLHDIFECNVDDLVVKTEGWPSERPASDLWSTPETSTQDEPKKGKPRAWIETSFERRAVGKNLNKKAYDL